jgi:hypothetical protein
MDANIRRPLSGPVAPLALKSESLQEVAQFEAIAQNLLNHEQGAFGSTAAIWGRPGERRVLAPSVTEWAHAAFPELRAHRPCRSKSATGVETQPCRILHNFPPRHQYVHSASMLAHIRADPGRSTLIGPQLRQEMVTPLSTGRTWPVTMRDSSLAR